MGRRNVVGAGADIEESGRPLGRVGTGVEGAMVGQHVGAQAGDPAVTGSRQLGGHMIVAREGRGREVLHRSEEHTSELQSLMRISYAVFCLKQKSNTSIPRTTTIN